MMGEAIIMFVCAIGVAVGIALLPTADEGRPRTIGKWCVGGLAVATAMQIVAWIGRTGHGADVLVFVAIIGGCAVLFGGVVWYMRHRPTPSDTEPVQRNFVPNVRTHAWGTYDAQTVAARKRRSF